MAPTHDAVIVRWSPGMRRRFLTAYESGLELCFLSERFGIPMQNVRTVYQRLSGREARRPSSPTAQRQPAVWTAEMDAELCRMWWDPRSTVELIAQRLGVGLDQARHRAKRLNMPSRRHVRAGQS